MPTANAPKDSATAMPSRIRSAPPGAADGSSWTPDESQVESCEHQNNANIHRQPFPESVSEEREIYTDYDGYHRHHVKHDSDLSAHSSGNRHFEFSIT
jgi:hypothetical protein